MSELVQLDSTNFLHRPNWSGATNEKLRFSSRSGPIVINDPNALQQLQNAGCEIRWTTPREGEEEGFVSRPFIYAKMKFKGEGGCKMDPTVYLVVGDKRTLLTRESVGLLDSIRCSKVRVLLNIAPNTMFPNDPPSVFVRVMYCYQQVTDPWDEGFSGDIAVDPAM